MESQAATGCSSPTERFPAHLALLWLDSGRSLRSPNAVLHLVAQEAWEPNRLGLGQTLRPPACQMRAEERLTLGLDTDLSRIHDCGPRRKGASLMKEIQRGQRVRRSFSTEYKAEVVERVRQSGQSPEDVARDLEFSSSTVRSWLRQAGADSRRGGKMGDERAELVQLRRENQELRQQLDSLKQVTSFFGYM